MAKRFVVTETSLLRPVPSHLTADVTRITDCARDIKEVNKALDLIYVKLEDDRDFPIIFWWPEQSGKFTKRKETMIKNHLEAAGYVITCLSGFNPTITISQPVNPSNAVKKQKTENNVQVEKPIAPPAYDANIVE
jgi:hypothetical protein